MERSKERRIYDEEKKSIKTDPELIQMLKLADKNIKSHYNCIPYT